MQPTFKLRNFPFRGPNFGEDINGMMGDLSRDLHDIYNYLTEVLSNQNTNIEVALYEYYATRARTLEMEAQRNWDNLLKARAGETLNFIQDFRKTDNLTWGSGANTIAEANRLRFDQPYGQLILPYNRVKNHFYSLDVSTGQPIQEPNLTVTTQALDEGTPVSVSETDNKNAFNGINASYWKRTVRFAIENDVSQVTCTLQVDVPASLLTKSNVLVLHPYPAGQVDILNIQYSTTTADPSITLPGFPSGGVNNATMLRYHFAPLEITKLKVTLRQRTPVEWDGYRVFSYGLQELGLQLVEFDHTAYSKIGPYQSNAAVFKVHAPEGFTFEQILDFYCDPYYDTGADHTKIYYHIYVDETLTTEVWNSEDFPNPSSTPIGVTSHTPSILYVLAAAGFDSTNNVSPVLEKFALRATVE